MLQGWVVVLSALVYLGLLFAVASLGDRHASRLLPGRGRPAIYALSLAVYCTSWTFFGSVGLAVAGGYDFLAIYIGPILMFTIGFPIVRRVVQLAKRERITSIADFIGARYGKSQPTAAVVTIIAVIGTLPYIALQLKAVSNSVETMVGRVSAAQATQALPPFLADISLFVTLVLSIFAVLFGTRHIDATEHQNGLMLAIATESIVKLIAFVSVGLFITFGMFDGPWDLIGKAAADPSISALFGKGLAEGNWIVMTVLSFCAILLLPRQFHVTVTENHNDAELKRAMWLFPVYLVLINLFVVPIAIAGLATFGGTVDADSFVLALPMHAGADFFAMIAFIGGLSAATAMVIVASVALSIMICNDLVVPMLVRGRNIDPLEDADLGSMLLNIRRMAIFVVLLLAFVYYRAAANTVALASIGLLSFAAIAQFAPAFFGGLVWRRATARGAIAGMLGGFAVWFYTLMLPTFVDAGLMGRQILDAGPFGLALLKPTGLFGVTFDPLTHGVFWSLAVNLAAFVFVSLTARPEPIERVQANLFVPTEIAPTPSFRRWRTSVTVADLRTTVGRYLGAERAERAFERFARENDADLDDNVPADVALMRFSEQTLASAIGAPSARLVLTLLVKRRDTTSKAAMKLLDDASTALQYNRDLLQTALDQVGQGISVFDRDLSLICWNRQFRELLNLPAEFGHVGTPLNSILRHLADIGELGEGPADAIVADRLDKLLGTMQTYTERLGDGTILEVRTSPMPGGGIVTTYTDITARTAAQEDLAKANETLERRVIERTEELTRLNGQLVTAKSDAEQANLGKTKFLAAAGHDILQPLNAARLYVSSLVERFEETENRRLVHNVEASLGSVEEIIAALLDISRLDSGAMQADPGVFPLDELLEQLEVDFSPMAEAKGIGLTFVPCTLWVRSDRRLLRRLLQNLVSNAIKYTAKGRVLVGCRRRGKAIQVEVIDTGMGIVEEHKARIFEEFHRLDEGARMARGLGLGLSIVDRIGRLLGHPVEVVSRPGKGSRFTVSLPVSAPLPRVGAPAGGALPRATPLEGLLVVCIDNDAAILDGMRTLLEGWQCRVVTSDTAQDAARHIHALGAIPDVLLVDYHLDVGTGMDAVSQLRWRFDADLPAVLITADRSPEVRDAAAERRMNVLHKPLKPAALRALLSQWRLSRQAAE